MNGKTTNNRIKEEPTERTFVSQSQTDFVLPGEKNSVIICCKDKKVPEYCIGFCSERVAGQRSIAVGLGKCKEHMDTIKICKSSETTKVETTYPKQTSKVFKKNIEYNLIILGKDTV